MGRQSLALYRGDVRCLEGPLRGLWQREATLHLSKLLLRPRDYTPPLMKGRHGLIKNVISELILSSLVCVSRIACELAAERLRCVNGAESSHIGLLQAFNGRSGL